MLTCQGLVIVIKATRSEEKNLESDEKTNKSIFGLIFVSKFVDKFLIIEQYALFFCNATK